MSRHSSFFIRHFFLLLPFTQIVAAPGDTLVVQTFTFDSIATRRAIFDFPTEGRDWSKVLMRYALKCDEATPGDPNPCGEWDVTTHTRIHRHTGQLDSLCHEQAWFSVKGEEPDSLELVTREIWNHQYNWSDYRRPEGNYLHFDGHSSLELDARALAALDSTFSLSLWVRGEAGVQPASDQLFEASANGARVINLNLPWSSGAVIFECGGHAAGNNNRIEKQAEAWQTIGLWNHWTFTKDTGKGQMRIYLNGVLFHEAGKMSRTMEGITQATLGANSNRNGGWFTGDVDDFCLWNNALDESQIRQLVAKGPSRRDDGLLLWLDFESVDMAVVQDRSRGMYHARMHGEPELRRHGWTGRRDALPDKRAELELDSLQAAALTVVYHEDEQDLAAVSRFDRYWRPERVIEDGLGRVIAQVKVDADTVLHQRILRSWDPPREVIEEIELGRYITPYGLGLNLGEEGFVHWREVTDFLPLLAGEVDLEAHNGYELIDLSFFFIEGRPARRVLAVDPVWPLKSHAYKDLAADLVLEQTLLPILPEARGAALLSTISGHGHAGPHHCCEWDPKEHFILLGGRERERWTVWRNCGDNPIMRQGGTWQFDRAGWCPGTFVDTHVLDLSPWITPGDSLLLDYGVEAPDPLNGEGEGAFIESHLLVQYGPILSDVDIELQAILSLGSRDECRRLGPATDELLLLVRNRGRLPVSRLELIYGLDGGLFSREFWQGELAFMQSDTLRLPAPDWTGWVDGAPFVARILPLAGEHNLHDNRLLQPLPAPLILPERLIVEVRSPGFGRAAENRWRITDWLGRTVASRDSLFDDSLHRDEINLPAGAYRFVFEDDAEDGLIRHWWLRGSDPERMGENGSVKIFDEKDSLKLNLGCDFAEGVEAWFFVGTPGASAE